MAIQLTKTYRPAFSQTEVNPGLLDQALGLAGFLLAGRLRGSLVSAEFQPTLASVPGTLYSQLHTYSEELSSSSFFFFFPKGWCNVGESQPRIEAQVGQVGNLII